MGVNFFLETDHHPLQYLYQAKFQNSRIMRWSLILQPYRFTVRAIKGSENVGADFLSRYASRMPHFVFFLALIVLYCHMIHDIVYLLSYISHNHSYLL